MEVASKKIVTDMPLRAAPALLELAAAADLDKVKSVVLEPGRYARELAGTYTIAPKVLEQQKLFDRVMKPVQCSRGRRPVNRSRLLAPRGPLAISPLRVYNCSSSRRGRAGRVGRARA